MTPSDIQRLCEQLMEVDCDRVVTAAPGRALAILHKDNLLLVELSDAGTLHIHGDCNECFGEYLQTDSFEEASEWLEEWLDDVSSTTSADPSPALDAAQAPR